MKISVELTLTPIQDDYEPAIKNFIKKLRSSGLKINENPLSTQVYGEYNKVMQLLTTEVETALESVERGLIHIKIVKSDRSNYEPGF